MSFFTQAITDFRTLDELESVTYISKTTAGSTNYPIAEAFGTAPSTKAFGEAAVKGYMVESVGFRFVASDLAATPKAGDELTARGQTYEVGEVERLRPVNAATGAGAFWRVAVARAYVDDAWDESIILKRFTLGVDIAGSVTESSPATTVGTYNAIVMFEDDQADLINRLGVKSDKQVTTFFVAQSVPVLPMDFITYGSRDYRITTIADEVRVSRLKRIRVELYG